MEVDTGIGSQKPSIFGSINSARKYKDDLEKISDSDEEDSDEDDLETPGIAHNDGSRAEIVFATGRKDVITGRIITSNLNLASHAMKCGTQMSTHKEKVEKVKVQSPLSRVNTSKTRQEQPPAGRRGSKTPSMRGQPRSGVCRADSSKPSKSDNLNLLRAQGTITMLGGEVIGHFVNPKKSLRNISKNETEQETFMPSIWSATEKIMEAMKLSSTKKSVFTEAGMLINQEGLAPIPRNSKSKRTSQVPDGGEFRQTYGPIKTPSSQFMPVTQEEKKFQMKSDKLVSIHGGSSLSNRNFGVSADKKESV
jgi:hypothetical protein